MTLTRVLRVLGFGLTASPNPATLIPAPTIPPPAERPVRTVKLPAQQGGLVIGGVFLGLTWVWGGTPRRVCLRGATRSALPCLALMLPCPTHPALFCPALACPALPCPALPCPVPAPVLQTKNTLTKSRPALPCFRATLTGCERPIVC